MKINGDNVMVDSLRGPFQNRTSQSSFCLFLIGLFSATQIHIVGSIGISELICFFVAPIIFVRNYRLLRNDGFLPIVNLSFLGVLGCIVSSWLNASPIPAFLRGFAATYSIFVFIVVHHSLLRNNLGGLKWLLLGMCLSNVVNVFVFQQAVEVYRVGMDASSHDKVAQVTGGVLFWLNRLGPLLTLPTRGWYLQTPLAYSVLACVAMPIFTVATTDTGRSAMAAALFSIVMIAIGRKSLVSMKRIQKHILLFGVFVLIFAFIIKEGYRFLAENGYLNERATQKYEGQIKGNSRGKGFVGILMGGRVDFFAGLYIVGKRPVWGYGPWALDVDGLYGEFVSRYGDREDVEKYWQSYRANAARGLYGLMPAHSHIVGAWIQYGILGAIFWGYVLYLMYRLIRYDLSEIPQWYGYFALSVFSSFWAILFSPYGNRVGMPLFLVTMLLADAVRRGRVPLPSSMQHEIMKHTR